MEKRNAIEVVEIICKKELLGHEIDVYGTAEEPLFKAKDVAEWISHTDVSTMLRMVDDDEKGANIICTPGGNQTVLMLTEDGLYEILMLSRKPIAKQFKKGVKKILHEIRVKGGYIASQQNDTPEMIIARALKVADETIRRHEKRVRELERQTFNQQEQIEVKDAQITELNTAVNNMQTKVSYLDLIMQQKNRTLTVTEIAQDYGMSAKAFNRLLESYRVQRKVNGVWVVYAPYLKEGYVTSKTGTSGTSHKDGTPFFYQQTVWTFKGRAFLYHKLKDKCILPIIEQNN